MRPEFAMSVLLIGAAEAALVSKAPGKKKKTRPLQVVPFEPWKPAWPRLAKSNRTHLPFANGTNCLGILTAGKLRTFNWPGVWQSHVSVFSSLIFIDAHWRLRVRLILERMFRTVLILHLALLSGRISEAPRARVRRPLPLRGRRPRGGSDR